MQDELKNHDENNDEQDISNKSVHINLACVKCGYNIRGLKITEVCPECGFNIRRTLLFVIDPTKSQISQLTKPKLLGNTLVLITAALLSASLLLWVPYILYIMDQLGLLSYYTGFPQWIFWSPSIAAVLTFICLLNMRLLRKPTSEEPSPEYTKGLSFARTGLIAWCGFLLALMVYDHTNWKRTSELFAHFQPKNIDLWRSTLRLGLDLSIAMIIMGFKPIFTLLGTRSVYHRIVQINSQGFGAMLVAMLIFTTGDIVHIVVALLYKVELYTPYRDIILLTSSMLILVGSGMLTLALCNALSDAFRLSREMKRPVYTLDQIIS